MEKHFYLLFLVTVLMILNLVSYDHIRVNAQFVSVHRFPRQIARTVARTVALLRDMHITPSQVSDIISKLNTHKASGDE